MVESFDLAGWGPIRYQCEGMVETLDLAERSPIGHRCVE
jgi:hypothetical protein